VSRKNRDQTGNGSEPEGGAPALLPPEPTTGERIAALRAAGEVLDGVLRDARRSARAYAALPWRDGGAHLVLLVDDLPEVLELYRTALQSDGFSVVGVSDGAEAVDRAIALRPDAIIMDFAMPGLDGGQAVRRLAADPRTCSIPVLMISAFAERVPRDVRLRCAAFLAKPCDIDELSGLLHLIVSVRSPRG